MRHSPHASQLALALKQVCLAWPECSVKEPVHGPQCNGEMNRPQQHAVKLQYMPGEASPASVTGELLAVKEAVHLSSCMEPSVPLSVQTSAMLAKKESLLLPRSSVCTRATAGSVRPVHPPNNSNN